MRNLEEFNGAFKDKPCFIIASGTSVKDVPVNTLNGVTIAVNSGYMAHQECDFFISDDWEVAIWSYFAVNLRNSQTKVLLYEDKLADRAGWFGDRSVLFRHRKGYHLTDTYEHDNAENHIVQARTSVGSAIHVAHIMGCSPIIVLGLDCYRDGNYRWFWQYPDFPNKPKRLDGRRVDKYSRKKGSDSDTDLEDILRYWKAQGNEINKRCLVYNASKDSKVEIFPKIDLKDYYGSDAK